MSGYDLRTALAEAVTCCSSGYEAKKYLHIHMLVQVCILHSSLHLHIYACGCDCADLVVDNDMDGAVGRVVREV